MKTCSFVNSDFSKNVHTPGINYAIKLPYKLWIDFARFPPETPREKKERSNEVEEISPSTNCNIPHV